MSSFKKKCTFCGQEIQLSNDGGSWRPYNLDNTSHECKKQSGQQPQQQTEQKKSSSTLTLEDLEKRLNEMDLRLKKAEAVLFGK